MCAVDALSRGRTTGERRAGRISVRIPCATSAPRSGTTSKSGRGSLPTQRPNRRRGSPGKCTRRGSRILQTTMFVANVTCRDRKLGSKTEGEASGRTLDANVARMLKGSRNAGLSLPRIRLALLLLPWTRRNLPQLCNSTRSTAK